jgi:hypothetical protein
MNSAALVAKVFSAPTFHVVAAKGPFNPEVTVRTLFEFASPHKSKESSIFFINLGYTLVFFACLAFVIYHATG